MMSCLCVKFNTTCKCMKLEVSSALLFHVIIFNYVKASTAIIIMRASSDIKENCAPVSSPPNLFTHLYTLQLSHTPTHTQRENLRAAQENAARYCAVFVIKRSEMKSLKCIVVEGARVVITLKLNVDLNCSRE